MLTLLVTTGCTSVPQGRFAIDDVTIHGAEQVDEDDIQEHIATAPSPKFLGLFRGVVYEYTVYNRVVLEHDLKRIRRYYRARGYYDAQVWAARAIPTGGNHLRVAIVVVEGKPVTVRHVRLRGLRGLPQRVVEAVQEAAAEGLPLGEPFEEERFEQTEVALQRALTDHGYAYAEVTRDAFVDVARRTAECTFSLQPDRMATFGEVTIVGLGELPDRPVRAALDIEPGETYSTERLAQAEQALLELGVLSSAEVTPQLSDPPPAARVVPVVVRVEPAKLRTVRLGGGVQLDGLRSDVHLVTGWEDRNFLGGMRKLSFEVRPGLVFYPLRINNWVVPEQVLPEVRVRTELRQPSFIEGRTTGVVRPKLTVFPVLLKTETNPDDPLLGYVEQLTSLGLERSFWKLHVGLSQQFQVDVPFSYRGPLHPTLETLLIAYPELITNLDLRDDRIHPHRGVFVGHSLQVAPFGDAHDVRLQPELRGYAPLHERITLAGRASVGFLFPLNYGDTIEDQLADPPVTASSEQAKDLQLLYFRGFFSGGPNSNRGYPPRAVSPHGYIPYLSPAGTSAAVSCDSSDPDFDPATCSVPIGGFSLWELSVELRFAIVGPLLAATFCDASDVAPERGTVRLDHPHLSCGAGLRYDTPVGPIRLDVGYRIPGAQVLEDTDPRVEGDPGTIFGAPMAISFGIGEAY